MTGNIRYTASASTPSWPPRPDATGSPNVVVVLVDDMGYSDIGCYGSEIPTPNIDALSDKGVRFSNFHVAPTCTPTRASLLTGRNPHRAGFGRVASYDPGYPGYSMEFPDEVPTIASKFRDSGYATFAIGKWHLAREIEQSTAGFKHGWPLQKGFDRFYGFLDGFTNFFHPHQLVEDNHHLTIDEYPDDYYLTDDLTDKAVGMIRDLRNGSPDKPFFMYFAHGAVHAPFHAPREDVDRFSGVYADGWTKIRERRFERQKELGLIPADTVLPEVPTDPRFGVPDWATLSPDEQRIAARYMEVYAAMVTTVDRSVGRIRAALEETGEWDNTVIAFMSDNGASSAAGVPGTTRYMWGHGARPAVPPDPELDMAEFDLIGGPRNFPHYSTGWALTCNTPFRLYKSFTHAGGHSVPLVVHWPAGDLADGETRHEYAHVSDLMPTLLELTGADDPGSISGLDGASFVETLRGEVSEPHRTEQLYESFGSRGYYRDGWEIVHTLTPLEPFSDAAWELYNLDEDPTETTNLAASEPERVKEMSRLWHAVASAGDVFPLEDGSGVFYYQRPGFHAPTEPAVFRPGGPTIERIQARDMTWHRSFAFEVDLEADETDEGMLVSHGDQAAGYALYIEDGTLWFAINGGRDIVTLNAGTVVGQARVRVDVDCPTLNRWDVTVSVDGGIRAEAKDVWVLTGLMTPLHGIDIGITRGSPVVWDLHERHRSFPWTGSLTQVRYEPGEYASDAPVLQIEEMRRRGLAVEGADRPVPTA